jgi:hypothetical protein
VSYEITGTEYIHYSSGACWMTWGTLTCDFCGKEVAAETGEITAVAFWDGWVGAGGMDECPDCIRNSFTTARQPE